MTPDDRGYSKFNRIRGLPPQKFGMTCFKPVEFDGFKKQAGLNSFVMTPKKWIESINAVLIHQGLSQADRLVQLNKIAITQMRSLVQNATMKQLK